MNDLDALTPFTRNTSLVNFLPVPRYLFAMRLSSTALLLYILLLDRASLSKQNGWHNREGWVYLIYPVAELARVLGGRPYLYNLEARQGMLTLPHVWRGRNLRILKAPLLRILQGGMEHDSHFYRG